MGRATGLVVHQKPQEIASQNDSRFDESDPALYREPSCEVDGGNPMLEYGGGLAERSCRLDLSRARRLTPNVTSRRPTTKITMQTEGSTVCEWFCEKRRPYSI
jgi:hypothetical protein